MNKPIAALGDRVKIEWVPDENGSMIELNYKTHTGAALIVWRMEDDEHSPAQEAFAHRLVACLNACEGIPTEDLAVENSVMIEMLKERTALKEQVEQLENRNAAYRAGAASECARASIKVANTVMAERDTLLALLTDAKHRLDDMLKGDDGQAWKEAERFMPKLNAALELIEPYKGLQV